MELLESAGAVRPRRMFGGWGFYIDGLFAALMIDDRLYLKVNAQTRAQFQSVGGEPFTYPGRQQTVQVDYYTPPAEALESAALMRPWAMLAVQAALEAQARKRPTARAAPAAKSHAGKRP
jgi:DNA transformation protein